MRCCWEIPPTLLAIFDSSLLSVLFACFAKVIFSGCLSNLSGNLSRSSALAENYQDRLERQVSNITNV